MGFVKGTATKMAAKMYVICQLIYFSYFQISCIYDSSCLGSTLFKLAAKMAIENVTFSKTATKVAAEWHIFS